MQWSRRLLGGGWARLLTKPKPNFLFRSLSQSTTMSFGNFDLVRTFKPDYTDVVVSKYRSRVTGLTVIHLDYEAPIVNGYFVVGTEIFDDSGCPHTLEHLVFMGSGKYPHKGVLDLLANRAFSNGTNAWTDTDHTAYTISTAGSQGFLQLLPIYVDHILYPTITDAGFVTEVHHIDAKGHDAGVVYSEMQGRENTSGDLMALKSQRLVDPPTSAYRSETGGLMEALRVLTPEQIRKYHSSYYVPHNLALVVAGKLRDGTQSLLQVVQDQVEPNIIAHGQANGPRPSGWKRPFVETPSAQRAPPSAPIKETVEFPEQDESMGEISINFLGPDPNDFVSRKALDILSSYLTSSSAAPLNKEFVEIESPLCSYIYFGEDTRATHCNSIIYIGSVPTEELETFNEKLKKSFQRIVDSGIDMQRMTMVIDRDERQLLSKLESSKGDTFSDAIIGDLLYGAEDGSNLPASMDDIAHYKALRTWSAKDWANLLYKYYLEQPSVVVIGKPSADLAEKLEKDEKKRLDAQAKALGSEGLKKAEAKLEAAKAEHGQPIPKDIITSFPVPDVKSISWIPVQSVHEPGKGRQSPWPVVASPLVEKLQSEGGLLNFFVEYDHVESDFVTIHALYSLEKLPNHLRPYMSAYLSAFFSLPVTRADGTKLDHEAVVNQLDEETVSYETGLGVAAGFSDTFRVSIKTELSRYEAAVAWLRDLVFNPEFNKERLQVVVAKIQQSLPEMRRDGNNVLSSVWSSLLFDESSTTTSGGVLPQAEFIPKLAKELQENPDEVIKAFETIRSTIIEPSAARFAVIGNVLKLKNPKAAWAKTFDRHYPPAPLCPVPLASKSLSDVAKKMSKKATVVALPTIESSYVNHTTKGIQGFDHPDYPVLRIALEVLSATESYFWRYIRGSGLAYGAYASLDVEAGLLFFSLYRSANCIKAYEEAAKVIRGLVDGSIEFDTTDLDAAKSSIVYSVTSGVSNPGKAAMAVFTNQTLKGVPANHQVDLLNKYQAVTKEQVLDAFKKYFLPLFDAKTSVAVVVTAPGKVDDTAEALTKFGFEVTKRELEFDPEEMETDSDCESESSSEDGLPSRL